ncbi:hypothetical protein Kpol_1013p28 [Vanderwaltozyma polyspora DSM 70294]|uniref:Mitotic check point protein BFA1 n=1 Tax=Vanderwaltozyma polyspora (strain ATCC 22028 / DSM 70294 / BCRC 21397 / CBS 2163 / NBRC 10782 / NRRL Y-8283 / UCD 57-17) TaxID=436907 RepID=A7TH76_VANPO|nr:uncharacterized protein Kpol_1013p28 [Vanderwaltozyma polyspora DSM 70294]EDO18357.1 hypothetical protein Kpol_1013p28 [Vanderwaltozyma polyspora DSM 70294]
MSIRPMNFAEFPETSFEDLDTTLNKVSKEENENGNNNGNVKQSSPLRQAFMNNTPSITASSEGTVFSNMLDKYSSGSKTDDEGQHRMQLQEQGQLGPFEDDEEDFLNDFEEFQNKKDDFDEALKLHFQLRGQSSPNTNKDGLQYRTDNVIGKLSDRFERNFSISNRLKQPRSMMDIKSNGRYNLANSRSSGSLRERSNNGLKNKKSMPLLSRFQPTIEEIDDNSTVDSDVYDEESLPRNDRYDQRNAQFLNNFQEEDELTEDEDFKLDEGLIKPQFLNSRRQSVVPMRLSPSEYDIVADDTLLTPRLHKRSKDWNGRSKLNSFKERKIRNYPSLSKIKTIKQEIDHNTPIKKGRMYYNPQTMMWEGNEKILEKFQSVDSNDKKPLLIRTKSQLSPKNKDLKLRKSTTQLTNPSREEFRNRPSVNNPRIVGNMMFDDVNLRWVSTSREDEEHDPFKNIPELKSLSLKQARYKSAPSNDVNSPFLRSKSHQIKRKSNNNNNTINSRFLSTGHNNNTHEVEDEEIFELNAKMLEKFYHEEHKWYKKIGSWIILSSDGKANKKSNNYKYEIRSMVMNSSRG